MGYMTHFEDRASVFWCRQTHRALVANSKKRAGIGAVSWPAGYCSGFLSSGKDERAKKSLIADVAQRQLFGVVSTGDNAVFQIACNSHPDMPGL